jgi:uncharacterized protein YndB with AHSA1/START domain
MSSLQPIRLTTLIGTIPQQIYDAWLDSQQHSRFTGGEATIDPRIGGRHTAWDGYIQGSTLELDPGRRIVQSWRSVDFPETAPDSRVEVLLESVDGGTQITLVHSNIPEGQRDEYERGWVEHYFEPMKRYFEEGVDAEAPPPTAAEAMPIATERPKARVKAKVNKTKVKKIKARPKKKLQAKAKAKPKKKAKAKAKPKKKAKAKKGKR